MKLDNSSIDPFLILSLLPFFKLEDVITISMLTKQFRLLICSTEKIALIENLWKGLFKQEFYFAINKFTDSSLFVNFGDSKMTVFKNAFKLYKDIRK